MHRLTRLLAFLILLALLVLTGCGDDDRTGTGTDPTTEPSGVSAVSADDLDDDWGCGFGFARSDSAETVMLTLFRDYPADGPLTREIRLPDPAWEGELRFGTNLGANWCADVITEPEAEVEETWRIVGGTIRFTGALPPADRRQSSPLDVRAELTDVVVESPDGERHALGDVPLRNEVWGFLAG